MLKRITLYLAIASLIFIGADKALTQDTETVAIIVNIGEAPATLTGDWHDAIYTIAWDQPYTTTVEDGGALSRQITVDPGDQGSVTLVHSFNKALPEGITWQPSEVQATPGGFLDAYNSASRLMVDATSLPVVITLPETTMWNLAWLYQENDGVFQYNQIMTWELTVN